MKTQITAFLNVNIYRNKPAQEKQRSTILLDWLSLDKNAEELERNS